MNNLKFLDPIKRRIHLMVTRAVLRALSDNSARQYVQVEGLKNEVRSDVERCQEYGFTSVPLAGAHAILLSVGGNRAHSIVIGIDDPRYRKSGLEPGEVCIYTHEGDFICLKKDNKIEIETKELLIKAETKVRIETPVFEVTGDIEDRCDTDGQTMNGMREVYNNHHHPENDSGGPTDVPNEQMGEL